MATWSVKVIGAPGVTFTPVVVPNVKVHRVKRERLPGLGSASFSFKTKNTEAATALAPELLINREVQIFRNAVCVWWGIPLQPEGDLTSIEVPCVGLLWWLYRRFFGPVWVNLLDPNSDFEAGLTNWTPVNCTATASTAWRAQGTQSAKLVQAAAGADAYLRRRVTISTGTSPTYYAAKALLHVPNTGWTGPALEQRGLYLELQTSAGAGLVAGVDPEWDSITNATERSHHLPIRLEKGITAPANLTNACIETRLYAPGVSEGVYWDGTALAVEQSVGTLLVGTTLIPEAAWNVIQRILDYAQGPEKDSLNIGFSAEAGTFPNVIRVHQFFDHANVFDGMMAYVKEGLLEFDITWPADGSSRTLRVWPVKRGTLKAAAAITLGVNVGEGLRWGADASGITTAPRWLGQGAGAVREVGRAVDISQVARILESVESAPADTPVDALYARAAETAALDARVKKAPRFPVRASLIIDNDVQVGDTVPVTANHGYIQEAGNRRVAELDFDAEADTCMVGWE